MQFHDNCEACEIMALIKNTTKMSQTEFEIKHLLHWPLNLLTAYR